MTSERRDLLPECLRDLGPSPPPLPEFKATFCDHCSQKECTRSLVGTSKFDQRVSTWEDRLFKNPQKLPQDDPRFLHITAQRFVDIAATQGVSIPILGQKTQSWVDPRELVQPEQVPSSSAHSFVELPPVTPSEKTTPEGSLDKLEVEVPAPATKVAAVQDRLPLNTPFKSGVMLGSSPTPTAPQTDSWEAPKPAPVEKGVTILKPGQKYRFQS